MCNRFPGARPFLSMQYQVLARKWRPKNFQELVGQEHVSRTLLNALQSNRVAHAFLFAGPRGSGKTTTARILAKALNCHRGKPGEPCSECVACVEIAAGNCMDVLEIDAASNRGIDEIRELKEKARYNPARDKCKIFIIDEVHMLTTEAFNALLKILEEPPSHVVFILATTEYHKIPATILSRCQQYSFKLIKYPLILERLRHIAEVEKIKISNAALEQVVFSSGGSMRDAMSALDQVIAFSGDSVRDEDVATLLGLVEPRVLSETVKAIAANDSAKILNIIAELVEAGQDLHNFCRRLLAQFRNLMVLKAGITDPASLGIPESLLADLREQAEAFSREDLLRLFEAFLKIEIGLKYSTQIRFQLEMGLIELSHISRLQPLEELIARFGDAAPQETSQRAEIPPNPQSAVPPSSFASGNSYTRQAVGVRPQPASSFPEKNADPVRNEAGRTEPLVSDNGSAGEVPAGDSRDLLLKIAGAVEKESLESMLKGLRGASIELDRVILQPEISNEFLRRQISENLPIITKAAGKVIGRAVTIVLGELSTPGKTQPPASALNTAVAAPEPDPLERAKREPVIKSFLDVFPGPVKAEKIES